MKNHNNTGILFLLSMAGMRKKKSVLITLCFLFCLTVLFLDAGLTIMKQTQTFYSDTKERLQDPDFFVMKESGSNKRKYETFISEDPRTDFYEKEDVVYLSGTKNNCNSMETDAVLLNRDRERSLSPFRPVLEDTSVPADRAIYLPLFLQGNGASLGSEYILTWQEKDYPFTVAGFFETTYLGSNNGGALKYYVSQERFQELYETTSSVRLLSVRLKGTKEELPLVSASYKEDFTDKTDFLSDGQEGIFGMISCMSGMDLKATLEPLLLVPSLLFISFAFIIGTIAMLVACLKVAEEIGDMLPSVGSLQAAGFTTRQIMRSFSVQFLTAALAGGLLGLVFGKAMAPLLTVYGIGAVGFELRQGFYPVMDLVSLAVTFVLIAAAVRFGTGKYRKLSPVTALRKGIQTHHFGRNFFPLSRGRGPVTFSLAAKETGYNVRQSFSTLMVVALGVFVLGTVSVLYGIFTGDSTLIARMTGMEVADLQLSPMPHTDLLEFQKELEALPEIEKTNLQGSAMVRIGDTDVSMIVSGNFEKMEVLAPFQGEFPQYENEVVLSYGLLRSLKKQIGDTVHITASGVTRPYRISGYSNTTNFGGRMGIMQLNGIRRMRPDYRLSLLDVYLKEGVERGPFVEKLYALYGGKAGKAVGNSSAYGDPYRAVKEKTQEQIAKLMKDYGVSGVEYAVLQDGELVLSGNSSAFRIKNIMDMQGYLHGQVAGYAGMIAGMVSVIFLVTFLIIAAIISITVKSMLRKKKEEYGIYKAMGYTTADLMKLLSVYFLLLGIAGAALGSVLCGLFSGGLLQLFFRNIGLTIAQLPTNPRMILCLGAVMVFFVWLLAVLHAVKVRKITVYSLLTE